MSAHRRFLFLATALLAAACSADDIPDARIALPPPKAADAAVTPDGAAATPDAAAATPDAAAATPDAAAAKPDAPVTVVPDAPLVVPDAPVVVPDAPVVVTPDAPAEVPDVATGAAGAKLILNEVAPNITGSHDLVELLVTEAGSTAGIDLLQDFSGHPTLLAHLPALDVAAGDLVVVHMTPGTVTSEAASKTECADSACYAGAWDVAGESAGLPFTDHVLWVRDANKAPLDVVPFYLSTATPAAAFVADLPVIEQMGLWKTACPDPCDDTHVANLQAASVDWSNVEKTATGATVQRQPAGVNTAQKSDWQAVPAAKANTLGAVN